MMNFKNKILVLALILLSSNFVFVANVFSGKDGDEALQEIYQTYCSYEGMLKIKDGGKVGDRWNEEFKMLTEPHDHQNFIAMNNKLVAFSIFPHKVIEECPKLKSYLSALATYREAYGPDLREAVEFIYRARVKGEVYRQLEQLEGSSNNLSNVEDQEVIKELPKQNDTNYSWMSCDEGLMDKRVSKLYEKNGILYTQTDSGVFKSKNGGDNWVMLSNGLSQKDQRGDKIFTCGNKLYVCTNNSEIFESASSENWKKVSLVFPEKSIDVLYEVNNVLYAGTINGLFKSKNYGKNWVDISSGLTGYDAWTKAYKMVVSIYFFKGILYVGTRNGIFSSIDGEHVGKHELRYDSINDIVSIGDTLYIGTSSGIFKSIDMGENWVAVNHGLTTREIDILCVFNNTLYAGAFSKGIFKSDDGGENWIDISDKTIVDNDASYSYAGLRDLCSLNGVLYAATDKGIFKLVQKLKDVSKEYL